MPKHFEKITIEINDNKKEVIIPELKIGEIKKYITEFSNSGDNFATTAMSIFQRIVGLTSEEIDELTITDLDEIRKIFIKANQVFFRGADWIGLSKKMESMVREIVGKLTLETTEKAKQ